MKESLCSRSQKWVLLAMFLSLRSQMLWNLALLSFREVITWNLSNKKTRVQNVTCDSGSCLHTQSILCSWWTNTENLPNSGTHTHEWERERKHYHALSNVRLWWLSRKDSDKWSVTCWSAVTLWAELVSTASGRDFKKKKKKQTNCNGGCGGKLNCRQCIAVYSIFSVRRSPQREVVVHWCECELVSRPDFPFPLWPASLHKNFMVVLLADL